MLCPICDREGRRYGKDRKGVQRYFCRECYITFSDPRPPRPFGGQYLSMERAASAIHHLMEGTSVRGTCRILGMSPTTLLQLLLKVGDGCERIMEGYIAGVPCETIQCDEVWSFIYCKERTRTRKGYKYVDIGDCYVWTALNPRNKLILTYAVGKRDNATGMEFLRRLKRATRGPFQLDTDGLTVYQSAIPLVFGYDQAHAQVIKIFNRPSEGEARYSPPDIIDIHIQAGGGNPDLTIASTSLIERSNLTIRMMLRRFTRLTNGFSKSWRYHEAAIAVLFCYYNFVRPHMTLSEAREYPCTPAMAANLVGRPWTLSELIRRAIPEGEEARVS